MVGKQTLLRKLGIDNDSFLKAKEELLSFGPTLMLDVRSHAKLLLRMGEIK